MGIILTHWTSLTRLIRGEVLQLRESHFIQALHLLSRPDITIQEVAKECGYESLQEFLRDFEQRFGYSPEEYRTHVL